MTLSSIFGAIGHGLKVGGIDVLKGGLAVAGTAGPAVADTLLPGIAGTGIAAAISELVGIAEQKFSTPVGAANVGLDYTILPLSGSETPKTGPAKKSFVMGLIENAWPLFDEILSANGVKISITTAQFDALVEACVAEFKVSKTLADLVKHIVEPVKPAA